MKSPERLTPLLKQYYAIKKQHPGRILFFRMGDFYELFGDDAVTASSILGIALTSREHGDSGKIPLAGVPHHTLNRYLAKMLRAGFKIAVCDQVEDPRQAKGIVKREVVEVLTPGSITLDGVLDDDKPNYLAAVCPQGHTVGLSLLDITTGSFLIDEFDRTFLPECLAFYRPSEVVVPDGFRQEFAKTIARDSLSFTVTPIDDYRFDTSLAYGDLLSHFRISSLDGFGLGKVNAAIGAAGAALAYVRDLKAGRVGHISRITRVQRGDFMELDSATVRNLELVETPYEGRKNSLLSVIDKTQSSGGGRMLRSWILAPLVRRDMIMARQEAVSELHSASGSRRRISEALGSLPDLERLTSRIAMKKVGPRDIISLKAGLERSGQIKSAAAEIPSTFLAGSVDRIADFGDLIEIMSRAIVDEPPATLQDGGVFRKGYSAELDELISGIDEARQYIHGLQKTEREKTGISSLKVGFNKIFGYYIEVTNTHLSRVPPRYIRKQTLVSAERFITEELKAKEEMILMAEEKIRALEADMFDKLLDSIALYIPSIQEAASAVSTIDAIGSFTALADLPGYILPGLSEALEIDIKGSRHPVLETLMPPGKFVPNDIYLNGKDKRIGIITGPNMAGKSTYLRQVGLLTLMAQIGAPIPATLATIGICDRIFTRVGASDDIIRGRSTFMVEMTEAASILNNASDRSLILLDELGRGTSTYDGLAIAWSLVEYLDRVKGRSARTLFATHYHELIDLADNNNSIFNLQVAVKQWQGTVIFLYKIMPGGCDDSYGIQVAKLAGLPSRLLERAEEILARLEMGHSPAEKGDRYGRPAAAYQISLFSPEESRLRDMLSGVEFDKLTPLEALNLLSQLKNSLVEGEDGL
jgi:DNA mismatch repair protein MutS